MGLRLPPEREREIAALEADVRAGAQAIGFGLRTELDRRRPALAQTPGGDTETEGLLVSLSLDHEGEPDPVSLSACVAAHSAYATGRGAPEGISTGALALARLLVWAARAAMLGPAPKIVWIGPPNRRPELGVGQVALTATATVTIAGEDRRAAATALVAAEG